ncbi:MAG: hypothetical protein ABW061_06450 [Polyangiaceae bacterium]
MNWRTATVLLGLSSLLACAKATYDDGYPVDGNFGGTDNGGGPTDEGGAPAGGAPNGGSINGGAGTPVSAGAPSAGAPGHAGATSTGGKGGTSSGGATGTAGKGGATGVAGAGTGGSSAGAPSTGPCADPKDLTGGKSDAVGTGAGCFRTTEKFNSLGCSNFTGRTITVNGMLNACSGTKDTFAPAIDGYNYFEVSAGGVAYASFYWFSS